MTRVTVCAGGVMITMVGDQHVSRQHGWVGLPCRHAAGDVDQPAQAEYASGTSEHATTMATVMRNRR